MIAKRIDLIVGNDNLASTLAKMLSGEINKIFVGSSSDLIKNRFWHIINDCCDKIESVRFLEVFSTIISNILRSKIYDFKYSSQYQTLLLKLLQKSEFIKSKYLASDLLDECLRLNLIKREHLQNLSQKLK